MIYTFASKMDMVHWFEENDLSDYASVSMNLNKDDFTFVVEVKR